MQEDKKQLEELIFLNDIYYYPEHTWAKIDKDQIKVGISDFAQDQLGDIIFVEFPNIGDVFAAGEVFGQAESAKTVTSLYLPISGEIVSVNEELDSHPEIVNTDPYGNGWMIVIQPQDLHEVTGLLSKDGYINLLKES